MQKKKIAVLGIGSFGRLFATYLAEDGHEVIAIDKDPSIIEEIKDQVTLAVTMDATDEQALVAQGIEDMDHVILAMAHDFETSIVCAEALKRLEIRNISARYQTSLQKKVLELLGINDLFNPEEKAARSMAETYLHAGVRSTFFLSEEFIVAEVSLPKRYINIRLADLDCKEKYNISLITIKRQTVKQDQKRASDTKSEKIMGILKPDTILKAEDTIVVFGAQENISKFMEG